MSAAAHSGEPSYQRKPSPWQSILWAARTPTRSGQWGRWRLVARALFAQLVYPAQMRRWMGVVFELHSRGLADDLEGEYLRAVQPHVNRNTTIRDRAAQLIDHMDWMETAFQAGPFAQLNSGNPLVLVELPPLPGYEYMRMQLSRAPVNSPEGELLLSLAVRRAPDVQHMTRPLDVAVVAFSRFRVEGEASLVIGGMRGQRHPSLRLSPVELAQALQGWKAPVLMVRVMQELARHWGLHLVGLDPRWHQLKGWPYRYSTRHRDTALRVRDSYNALWTHFEARNGPPGWMVLPTSSDDNLAATALSPEKRARQIQRADYWLRTSSLLRREMRQALQRPGRDVRATRVTQSMVSEFEPQEEEPSFLARRDRPMERANPGGVRTRPASSRILETGPSSLV
jgi:uncharacterized protein VirK/YbjX